MFSLNGRRWAGSILLTLSAAAMLASTSHAQTVATINGKVLDQQMLNVYLENRGQKPIDQLTDADKETFTAELMDLFVLSTTDTAKELETDPTVSAQLELQRMAILSRFVAQSIAAAIVVTDEEIQALYDEQIKLAPNQQYKARHILLETQGEAVSVIQALIDGADFTELAKEKSTGPSGPNGGDLGWFTPDQMVPAFSQAVVRLQDGRYTTDPVQTQFGWHVILREESRAAEPPPLEGVRETIDARVRQNKLRAAIDSLKAEAME